jgi:hypothetical protein
MNTKQSTRTLDEADGRWIKAFRRAVTQSLLPPGQAASRRDHKPGTLSWLDEPWQPAQTFDLETGRLFADRKLAQRDTEFWETLVFGALGMSGLFATAIALLAM